MPQRHLPAAKLVVIAGGKGGVGTTTIALNLAVVLAQRGQRTALVDADPDGGNVATLCRLQERHTIADVLSARRTVRESLQEGPAGVRLLPGAWGLADLAECPPTAQQRLLAELQGLGAEADIIVVDVGDGSSRLVRRFWQAADAVLLVTTPELASIMDSYASIKVLAGDDDSMPVYCLVNMASGAAVAEDVQARLARACLRLLGIHLRALGHLADDPQVAMAGKAGEPFVLAAPGCPSARRIRRLAETLRARLAGDLQSPVEPRLMA